MSEHIAQMGPMLIIAGLAAGWLSDAVTRRGGYGLLRDMALGIGGSVIAGVATSSLIFNDAGMIGMFVLGLIGGAVAVAGQRTLWRSARSAA
jgi:uncharacterized membrane protein YeaQ/YmgE (transglycosylase-associated protein family)